MDGTFDFVFLEPILIHGGFERHRKNDLCWPVFINVEQISILTEEDFAAPMAFLYTARIV